MLNVARTLSEEHLTPQQPMFGSNASNSLSARMIVPVSQQQPRASQQWVVTARTQIEELAQRESHPAFPAVIRAAWFLLSLSEIPMPAPFISPTTDGGLLVEWHSDAFELTFEFESDGNISLYFRDADENEWEGALGSEPYPLETLLQSASHQ
jgi:hypothetical protein